MLIYALWIFAITAVGGLILASSVLRNRLAPWALSAAHALLGATGLGLLVIAVLQGVATGRAMIALGILIVAALGGFFLASFHQRGKVAPKAIVLTHAGLAVTGFLVLLSAVLPL